MMALLLAAALQAPAASEVVDSSSAFLDPGAAALLAGARARSDSSYVRIGAFSVVLRQRASVGLNTILRDRLAYKRDEAWRVSWGGGDEYRIEVLGSREIVPLAMSEPGVGDLGGPGDPRSLLRPEGQWWFRMSDDDDDDDGIRHPLAPGAEANYRYASGDTSSIRLADGTTLTLIELRVIPRRSNPRLVAGTLWLETRHLSPVRGVFSLAAPFRLSAEASSSGVELPIPLPDASFNIELMSVEYALWEREWWLPRRIVWEGSGKVSGFTFPVLFERSYEVERLTAWGSPDPPFESLDSTLFAVRTVDVGVGDDYRYRNTIIVPKDTSSLLTSQYIPESAYSEGIQLATEADVEQLADLVSNVADLGLSYREPRIGWAPLDPSLLRFNRVEGLALGTRAWVEHGPYTGDLELLLATAQWAPSASLTAARAIGGAQDEMSIYYRHAAFNPTDRPFSLGSSIGAFFLGDDYGDYFRTTGIGLSTRRELDENGASVLAVGAFGEMQRSVEKGTDASLTHWTRDRTFRGNPAAERANQVGLDLSLRARRGLNPNRFRGTIALATRAEAGTFRFVRPSADVFLSGPLPGSLLVSLIAAGGAAFGELPPQSLWYLGGPGTVRGFRPEERHAGTAYWRGRAEIANDRPAARLILFTDAGWAGDRGSLSARPSLVSAGVGASILDGLLRLDLAKAVRGGSGWGVQLYFDGAL